MLFAAFSNSGYRWRISLSLQIERIISRIDVDSILMRRWMVAVEYWLIFSSFGFKSRFSPIVCYFCLLKKITARLNGFFPEGNHYTPNLYGACALSYSSIPTRHLRQGNCEEFVYLLKKSSGVWPLCIFGLHLFFNWVIESSYQIPIL